MKRLICVIVMFSLVFCLFGCETDPEPTTPTETLTEPTEPAWPGYTGPKDEYIYFHEDPRDVQWEEDVIYFANSYLQNHPLLRNRLDLILYPNSKTDSAKFLNEQLRADFLAGINELIPQISELTDNQIIGRMMMLLASFEDLHTSLSNLPGDVFPICFTSFYEDGEFVYYVNILPEENASFFLSTLVAINGYPLEEVLALAQTILGYENEYGLASDCGNGYSNSILTWALPLQALGIMEPDSTSIVYTLKQPGGRKRDLTLELIGDRDISYAGWSPYNAYSIAYGTNSEQNFWFTTDLADHTLYLRINSFQVDTDADYGTLGNQLNLAYQQEGGFQKIIIDLRDNGGGYDGYGYTRLLTLLKSYNCDNIYLLINGGSCSRTTIFVAEVIELMEGVTIVGTPSGQNTEFFASMSYDYIMPNSGIICNMPSAYWDMFPEEACGILMPDVVIWPTVDDFLDGYDATLEYVLSQ